MTHDSHITHPSGPVPERIRCGLSQDQEWCEVRLDDAWKRIRFHGYGEDDSGFSGLIAGMLRSGAIDERGRRRYRHRLDVSGDPISYVAIAGVKRSR